MRSVDHDDAGLARAAAAGDETAFRCLVERHYDACLRYAVRMLGDRDEAEDVVQDAFIRAYRHLDGYVEGGCFRAWLFRILVNRCRTEASRRKRRHSVVVTDLDLASVSGATEAREAAPFQHRILDRALATLPGLLREAFLLKFVEEMTYEEIGELTGASVSALKMRVARARSMLREQLQEAVPVDE